MKKAITPIISIIILLFITVGLLGGIWPYMSEYFETMMKAIDIPPGATYCRENKVTIVIRNPGQSPINNSDRMAMLGLFHNHPDAVGAWRFEEEDGNATQDSSPNSNTGSIYGDTVLLMHFDEGSGLGAYDETSYGNDGGRNGATWKMGGCQSGTCLEFDGDGDYVDCGTGSSLDITVNFTISAWVYLNRIDATGGYVVAKRDGSNGQYGMFVAGSDGDFDFIRDTTVIDSDYDVPTTTWKHLLFVVNSTSVSFYVDGSYYSTKPLGGTIPSEPSVPVLIGTRLQGGAASGHDWNGSIDEVAIYSRALTGDEINAMYEAGRAKFIERGKLGRFGYGMEFDGDGDYVELTSYTNINNNITLSAWIKYTSCTGTDGICYIVGDGQYEFSGAFKLGIRGAGTLAFVLNGPRRVTSLSSVYNDDKWHHVIGVYNGTNQILYIDGNFDNETSATGLIADSSDWSIGGFDGIYRPFNGTIDEVVILDRALTQEEIQAQLTPACSCSGNICECGDLTIARTAGEGYFHPYFDKPTIEPEGSVRMTDYNCMSDICTYRITSPAASIKIDVECT